MEKKAAPDMTREQVRYFKMSMCHTVSQIPRKAVRNDVIALYAQNCMCDALDTEVPSPGDLDRIFETSLSDKEEAWIRKAIQEMGEGNPDEMVGFFDYCRLSV